MSVAPRLATADTLLPLPNRMPRRSLLLAALVALPAFALGACSGDDGVSPGTSPGASPSSTASASSGGPAVTGDGGPGTSTPDASPGPDPVFDAKLYALPETSYPVTKIGEAIDALLAAKPALENVIVFVHGRSCGGGGEPTKSMSSVVPELETDYAAGVLMFFWPGSDDGCPLGFPEDRARASGPALRAMIARTAAWASSHPTQAAKVKLELLTHSLGNIVLEAALAQPTGAPPGLFSSAVLNSSAAALAGHATWLSNLDFASRAYVTVNGGDNILLAATAGRGARLGRDLGSEALSGRAAYVDFTASDVNHQYYVVSGQKGASMKGFYQDALRGRVYDLAGSSAITKRTPRGSATIYTFAGN